MKKPERKRFDLISVEDLRYAVEHELQFVVPKEWLRRFTLQQIQEAFPMIECVAPSEIA